MSDIISQDDYLEFFNEIKHGIVTARIRASKKVNNNRLSYIWI